LVSLPRLPIQAAAAARVKRARRPVVRGRLIETGLRISMPKAPDLVLAIGREVEAGRCRRAPPDDRHVR
jgi:hypothetical protein